MVETAIVLAGGLGTRLQSVLPDTPKCLAPVGDKTFLEILIRSLIERGFGDIVLALGHGAEKVAAAVESFGDLRGAVRIVVEQQPLGTGGAIANAMRRMKLQQAAVINGDTYFGGDLSAFVKPLGENELCRIGIVEVADRSRYGGVRIGGEKADTGPVLGFLEKGTREGGWINAGYYLLDKKCFDDFGEGQKFSLETDILPTFVDKCRAFYAKLRGELIDIGIPDDYRRFCAMWESLK